MIILAMSRKPSSSKTVLSQMLTQAVQRMVNTEQLRLKQGANVAEICIKDPINRTTNTYPLVGDRYILGRSSRNSDIVVSNPVVSQIHGSLHRDPRRPRHFYFKDEKATNGSYRGKKRIKNAIPLHHGDIISLGPPDLADTATLSYRNPSPLWMRLTRYALYGTSVSLGALIVWMGSEWSKVPVRPLPPINQAPVVVYDRSGKTPLSSLDNRPHGEIERLSEFSPYLPKAVIASEDSRFYWHLGVDPWGILRAIMVNLQGEGIKQGASTLTQQVARSLFAEVGRENTAERKIREILVALKLETVYSKDHILKTYLNRVYLGSGNYGFEDAAQFYFDKSARKLDIAESATLVAMLPAPNLYNPVRDYDTALSLRNRVITRMTQLGMISEAEASRARRSRIQVSPNAQKALSSIIAPYFYSYIFQELQELLGEELAKEGNFIVETGLNLTLQTKAEKALKNNVQTQGRSFGFSQGGLVTLDTQTGEILALVGGVDYQKSQFNRVTQAKRQPGSTFKVFAYTAALEQGITPAQTYSCEALRWQGQLYKPCERNSGDITLIQGFAQSENVVALRVAQKVGLNNIIQTAQRLGIKSDLKASPGLVLGESEVKLLEITGSYGAIANQGSWHRPHGIRRVLDGNDCQNPSDIATCREIYTFNTHKDSVKQVISPEVAQTLIRLMQAVVKEGTGKAAYLGRGEGGKTGTTDQSKDLWFIGFIPQAQQVTGVWLGNDDNAPTRGSSGQAAALWKDYMR